MRGIRAILLFPLGIIWGIVALIKRWLYVFLKLNHKPTIATWVIGNIHAGGQGKTPTIIALYEWLRNEITSDEEIAILSRGYGRKTKGYRPITTKESAKSVGDEPLEIYYTLNQMAESKNTTADIQKTNTSISSSTEIGRTSVFVCEDRIHGISEIQKANPSVSFILLDDGFQHLNLSALGSIILTKFDDPFCNDLPLPAGNLREFPCAAKSADIILVTHSSSKMSLTQAQEWRMRFYKKMQRWGIKPEKASWFNKIFFASYSSSLPIEQKSLTSYSSEGNHLAIGSNIILITGIAHTSGIVNALSDYNILHHFDYADHHPFSKVDLEKWRIKYNQVMNSVTNDNNKPINHDNNCVFVCTRKDYMRIMSLFQEIELENQVLASSKENFQIEHSPIRDSSNRLSGDIMEIPFYVCHSEIEILFNEKPKLINTILTRKMND